MPRQGRESKRVQQEHEDHKVPAFQNFGPARQYYPPPPPRVTTIYGGVAAAPASHGQPERLSRPPRSNGSIRDALTAARPNIFYTLRDGLDLKGRGKCVLNVATMQAVVLSRYQEALIKAGEEMLDGTCPSTLPATLHDYCEALRDMDYMTAKAANGFDDDPFVLTSSRQLERCYMKDHGLLEYARDEHGDRLLEAGLAGTYDDPQAPNVLGTGRNARLHGERQTLTLRKLVYAYFGGAALLVPMIIMVLVPNLICTLITTSAFVLVFCGVVALVSELQPGEILAATATYAAVLVVFVGTTS